MSESAAQAQKAADATNEADDEATAQAVGDMTRDAAGAGISEESQSESSDSAQPPVAEYTFESCTIEIRIQLMPARTLADREGEDRRVWIGVREHDGVNPGDPLLREVRLSELGGWPVGIEELLAQLRAEMPTRASAAKARQPSSANAALSGSHGSRGSTAGAGEQVRPTTRQLAGGALTPAGVSATDPSAPRPQFGAPMPRRAPAAGSSPSRPFGVSGSHADPESDGTPVVQQELF